MKILKIRKLKNNRYNITLSNEDPIKTYDEIILKHNLLFKKEISEELYKQILKESNEHVFYQKVLDLISRKKRSRKEIKTYLLKNDVTSQRVSEIIKKLTALKLLDDVDYAKSYVNDRFNLSSDGPNKIKRDLIHEGIEEEIIDEVIIFTDEEVHYKLSRLIEKKTKNNKDSKYNMTNKLTSYFYNMGYDTNMIKSILSEVDVDNTELIKKEYEKCKRRYEKKHSGYALEQKIRTYLYSKGYKTPEINKIINND